jgi:hypothetical protein
MVSNTESVTFTCPENHTIVKTLDELKKLDDMKNAKCFNSRSR